MPSVEETRHPERSRVRGGAEYAVQPFEYATEQEQAGVEATADIESNEMHGAVGMTCARCGQPLTDHTDIRRTATGDYVHESCSPAARSEPEPGQ
jgi:hypothetical protein